MSTYLELQDEVLSHQFSDAKYRAYIKEWLNEAEAYIAAQVDVRSQQSSVAFTLEAGVPGLALPDDFLRVVSADVDHGLYQIDILAYDELADASGTPTQFCVFGDNMVLYPTPDEASELLLRYYRKPAEMSVAGDEPEIPSQYHHLLVRYALIRCYQRENDYEAANYMEDQFQKGLMKMRGEAQYDTHDSPTQIPGSWQEPMINNSVWW